MKTAEEILKSKLNNTQWNCLDHVLHSGEVYKQILVGMEEYAEQFKISSNLPVIGSGIIVTCGIHQLPMHLNRIGQYECPQCHCR